MQFRYFSTLLALVLVFGMNPAASAFAPDADGDLRVGYNLFKRDQYKDAVGVFRKFLKDYPENKRVGLAHLYLGASLLELEEYSEARSHFQSFADGNPDDKRFPTALYRIGECSFNLGEYEKAEKVFGDFLARFKDHSFAEWALSYQGDTFLRLKKYDKAETSYRSLLKKYPQSELTEETEIGLGQALVRLKKFAEATALFAKYPNNETAVFQSATFAMNSGKYSEAAQAYDAFLGKFAKSVRRVAARLNGGYCHYRSGEFDAAMKLARQIPADSRYHARAQLVEGLSLDRLDRYDESEKVFAAAFAKYGNTSLGDQFLYNQAVSRFKLERFADSAALFEKVAKKWANGRYAAESRIRAAEAWLSAEQPENARALVADTTGLPERQKVAGQILFARVLRDSKTDAEREQALTILQAAAKTDDKDLKSEAMYYQLRPLRELNRHEDVLRVGKSLIDGLALREDRSYDNAYISYGMSALEARQPQLAVDAISSYLDRNRQGGDTSVALANRAIAYAELGKEAECTKDLAALRADASAAKNYLQAAERIADITWNAKQWQWSAGVFGILTTVRNAPDVTASGLSGRGWCYFKLSRFEKAAEDFQNLSTDFPNHDLAPEALFMNARATELAGDKKNALQKYQSVFLKFKPQTARPKEEAGGPTGFAFRAARFAAGIQEELNRISDANGTYDLLLQHYPQAANMDEIVNNQAVMNLEAGNFEKSDAAFRNLLRLFPNSERRFQAMHALADSDLVAGRIVEAEKVFRELSSVAEAPEEVRSGSLYQLIKIALSKRDWETTRDLTARYLSTFKDTPYTTVVQLHQAEAFFNFKQQAEAGRILKQLRSVLGQQSWQGWEGRVWTLAAEIELGQRNYDEARRLVNELEQIPAGSPYLYQAYEIVGRTWKQQAPPNFDRAREYFTKTINDKQGAMTETAAKAQFLIGETWVLQKDFDKAYVAFTRVHVNYKFPKWQAPALFQAASIEQDRKETKRALETYELLVEKHGDDPLAARARKRIQELRQQTKS